MSCLLTDYNHRVAWLPCPGLERAAWTPGYLLKWDTQTRWEQSLPGVPFTICGQIHTAESVGFTQGTSARDRITCRPAAVALQGLCHASELSYSRKQCHLQNVRISISLKLMETPSALYISFNGHLATDVIPTPHYPPVFPLTFCPFMSHPNSPPVCSPPQAPYCLCSPSSTWLLLPPPRTPWSSASGNSFQGWDVPLG